MPDMSGFEVRRSLRVSKVRMPILILSGLASTVDKVKGLGIGADDYLTKPFHRKNFVTVGGRGHMLRDSFRGSGSHFDLASVQNFASDAQSCAAAG